MYVLSKLGFLALAVICTITTGFAKDKDPFKEGLIANIHKLHSQSEDGDKKATKELITKLEKLTKENPQNYLLMAYLGSAYTLASRDAFPGPGKLKFLKTGLKTMDQAVDKAPNNLAVRFIRAVNNFHLPTFINRRDNARADFEILLKSIRKHPEGYSSETRQAIYYYAGLSFKQLKRKQEAKASWTEGVHILTTSDLAKKMNAQLTKL